MSPNAAARLDAISGEERASARRHFLEPRPGLASKQQAGLRVRIRGIGFRLTADAAVRFVEVEEAVVVEIAERHAKPRERTARRAQPCRHRVVDEELPLVPEERVRLAIEIDYQQIEIAIVIDIDRVDAHAGLGDAILIERRSPC